MAKLLPNAYNVLSMNRMIKYLIFFEFIIISCMAPIYEKSTISRNWDFRIGIGTNYSQILMYDGGDLCYWSIHKWFSPRLDFQIEKGITKNLGFNANLTFTPVVQLYKEFQVFPWGNLDIGLKLKLDEQNRAMKFDAVIPYGVRLGLLQGLPMTGEAEPFTAGMYLLVPFSLKPLWAGVTLSGHIPFKNIILSPCTGCALGLTRNPFTGPEDTEKEFQIVFGVAVEL